MDHLEKTIEEKIASLKKINPFCREYETALQTSKIYEDLQKYTGPKRMEYMGFLACRYYDFFKDHITEIGSISAK